MTTNLGFTPATQAATQDQLSQFGSLMKSQNWQGAVDYGRSQGYTDQQIADYTGQQGFNDSPGHAISSSQAMDYMNSHPAQQPQPQQQQPQAQPSGFYGNNLGMSAPTLDKYETNPYLKQMGADMMGQMTDNFQRNIMPGMRSGAMAAGGFGGSRQGVVEANGLNDLNRSMGQNLTSMYGQDWANGQNRSLQKYQADQGYNLGMANNNLGYAGLDAGIYNNNFNNQLNSAKFGLDAYGMMMNQGNLGINSAQTIQNTPMNYNNYFGGQYTNAGGLGGSSTQQMPGNPALGFLGGAQLANSIKF